MDKQDRESLWQIGVSAAVVALVALIALTMIVGLGFWGALVLAVLIGLVVAAVLFLGFHRRRDEVLAALGVRSGSGDEAKEALRDGWRRVSAAVGSATGSTEAGASRGEADDRTAPDADARTTPAATEAGRPGATAPGATPGQGRRADAAAGAGRQEMPGSAAPSRAAKDSADSGAAPTRLTTGRGAADQAPPATATATPPPGAATAGEAGQETERRPAGLDGPRPGGADDLKRIKGIGPKLEVLCNSMGFYHFDQIAGWSDEEVAWVDANLEGFRGRVTRDEWVSQARVLAGGGETDFSTGAGSGGS